MKNRDNRNEATAKLLDAEQVDILDYLNQIPDKSDEKYTKAVENLAKLAETEKLKDDAILERSTLKSEFLRGLLGGFAATGSLLLVWNSERTGDVMLNQSNKSFIDKFSRIKFRP